MIIFVGSKDKDGYDVRQTVIAVSEFKSSMTLGMQRAVEFIKEPGVTHVNVEIGLYETGYPFMKRNKPQRSSRMRRTLVWLGRYLFKI